MPVNDEDAREQERFRRLYAQVEEQARQDRKAAMLSDDMYALFDDQLLLHDAEPLTNREKRLLSYYVGYWDAGPYNDYSLSMIEDMDERERRITSKVLNVVMTVMAAGLVLLAIRQIVG